MPGCLIKAILLSMIVASISFFISHTQLLKKLRKWLWDHAMFFGMLMDCSYCVGHWVAVIVLIIFPVKLCVLFGMDSPADYFFTWLVISWLAGLQSLAASWLWGE